MSDSPYPLCKHLKDNGEPCGSPARKGEKLCYFHGRATDTAKLPGKPGYRLAMIECAESIQITVMHVNQALLDGTIDAKTANTIFRGLSLVKSVLSNLPNRTKPAPWLPIIDTYQFTRNSHRDLPESYPDTSNSTSVTNDDNRPLLSPSELVGLRKIVRQGPRHPDFSRATRILDKHIVSRSSSH